MSIAKDVASALVKSELWPGANPNTILMLCYLAEAEGHHPAVIYRDYHIMSGKPSKKAEAILRDFSAAGGRVEWHALDDKKADATFHHPSGTVRIEWTIERAQKAGLNTPMWKKYPRQMLRSRCISEGVRSVCPAATSGLYEENEVADIVAEQQPALEHHVPVETEPHPSNDEWSVRPKDDGPTKTALDRILKDMTHELEGCGDEDQLIVYTQTEEYQEGKALLEQYRPSALYGPPPPHMPEFVPIRELIKRKVAMFRMGAPEPNLMEAG